MSPGCRRNRARSAAGVSPLRTCTAGTVQVTPAWAAAAAMPASGRRRLRSMSTASAFSGETYSTRQRAPSGAGSNISRFRHQRKAASVLPLPVGATTSADVPRAMTGQAARCTAVGASNDAANQRRTTGWNGAGELERGTAHSKSGLRPGLRPRPEPAGFGHARRSEAREGGRTPALFTRSPHAARSAPFAPFDSTQGAPSRVEGRARRAGRYEARRPKTEPIARSPVARSP